MILFKVLRAMRWHSCIGFIDVLQHGVEDVVHCLLMLGEHIEYFSILQCPSGTELDDSCVKGAAHSTVLMQTV